MFKGVLILSVYIPPIKDARFITAQFIPNNIKLKLLSNLVHEKISVLFLLEFL